MLWATEFKISRYGLKGQESATGKAKYGLGKDDALLCLTILLGTLVCG